MSAGPPARAEVIVDLAAIRHNVASLRRLVAPAALMVVVKADGYGHGMLPVAQAAVEAGAHWLGVATIDEAVALREGGLTGPILCWLAVPGEPYAEAVGRGIDVTAYSEAQIAEIRRSVAEAATPARVQLKVDTGLSRGGAPIDDWAALVTAARDAQAEGILEVTGMWSHLAAADQPDHPANEDQERVFRRALKLADELGLRPGLRHLANSAAAILLPSARFDLVRCGIACYGLDPAPGYTPDLGLVPAMTVQTRLAMAKPITAGAGVSYGHTWVAEEDTTVGLVPVGYGDGVPRHGSSRAHVWTAGARRPVRGRVCMDQFVVDLGGDLPEAGTEVVLFGPGTSGEPTAQDWAEACGTINYEIVTRIGGRMRRRYVDHERAAHHLGAQREDRR